MKTKNYSFEEKNITRRFGAMCANCGKKLGKYKLTGHLDGKSVAFCTFKCHDIYIDNGNKSVIK